MVLGCRDMAWDKLPHYFEPFFAFNPVGIKKLKIRKTKRYYDFTPVYQKLLSYNVWLQSYGLRETEWLFWVNFCLFTLLKGLTIFKNT